MGRSRYRILELDAPHFLTCTVVRWIPLFEDPTIIQILLDSLSFLQRERGVRLFAYVIMKHHIHLIAESPQLSKAIAKFKSFTARSVIDYLESHKSGGRPLERLKQGKVAHKKDREFQVWQEGSHPQAILNDRMMRQKIDYIHLNPVKSGYVDDPLDWPYSSARNYEGMEGLLEVIGEW